MIMSVNYDAIIFIKKNEEKANVINKVNEILISENFVLNKDEYLIFNDLNDETEKEPISLWENPEIENEIIFKELCSWPGGGGISYSYLSKFSTFFNFITDGDFNITQIKISIQDMYGLNFNIKNEIEKIIFLIKSELNYERIIGDRELLPLDNVKIDDIKDKIFDIDIRD